MRYESKYKRYDTSKIKSCRIKVFFPTCCKSDSLLARKLYELHFKTKRPDGNEYDLHWNTGKQAMVPVQWINHLKWYFVLVLLI